MPTSVRAAIDRHLATYVERDVDPSRGGLDASLREDLGLSSLDAVSLLMALEDEFDVEATDQEVAGLRVLGDVVRLVETKRAARAS